MGEQPNERRHERGSALIIAVLVSVIMSLLGISYVLMAETENRIAENERRSAQALYMGEAGTHLVKTWFNRPGSLTNVINAPIAVIDRTQRLIDSDGDPGTPPVLADGTTAKPYYKQNVDLDGDGDDDVFDKPYRDNLTDTLLGTEAGPDVVIDETASTATKNFLMNLSEALLSGYPAWQTGVRARITRIDVYAPPYIDIAGTWTRYGMATVKVTARIYQERADGSEQILAERMIKAVLNETPFPGPFGPLHSCDELSWNGDFKVHWGVATAVSNSDLHNNHKKQSAGLPRDVPPGERLDILWGNEAQFGAYKTAIDGLKIDDPWFRYLSGGPIADAPNGNMQAEPFGWTVGDPFDDGDVPYHPSDSDPSDPYFDPNGDGVADNWDGCHSNMLQNYPQVSCPYFPYELWKSIATDGGSNVHYYVWDNGTAFKENGVGAAVSIRDILDNQEGIFFFDTKDGLAPYDDDGDGEYDNLTPEITFQGGTFGVRGFVYLNSASFRTRGLTGRAATFNAPGEPFHDKNKNGQRDAGEDWINLRYPANVGDDFYADANDTLQDDGTLGAPGSEMWNSRGPDMAGEAAFHGILYTNGYWDATGNAQYYGSVISKSGIGESGPTAGTPNVYWDQSIAQDWPPDGWDIPRVIITRWETDL